jgi:hypothetical protein
MPPGSAAMFCATSSFTAKSKGKALGLAETMYDDECFDDALVQAALALDGVDRMGYAVGCAWPVGGRPKGGVLAV